MADYIVFAEGAQYLLTHGDGLPSPIYFALSTNAISSFTAAATLAGGIAEITGTGYSRQSQTPPTPSGATTGFSLMSWSTGSATNWPATTKSIVAVSTSNNTGRAICAWNLNAGGGSVDMSAASTTLTVTPSAVVTS